MSDCSKIWLLLIFLKVKTTSSIYQNFYITFCTFKHVKKRQISKIISFGRRILRFWLSVYFWKWKPPRGKNQKHLITILPCCAWIWMWSRKIQILNWLYSRRHKKDPEGFLWIVAVQFLKLNKERKLGTDFKGLE